MSDFLGWFYPGDVTAVGAAAAFVQITIVIVTAAAACLLKKRAALRHAVWLSALGCVFASPLLAVFADRLGIGLLRLEPPHSQAIVDEEPSAPWVEPMTAPVSVPASSENRETAMPLVAPETAPLCPTNVSKVANIPNFAAPVDSLRCAVRRLLISRLDYRDRLPAAAIATWDLWPRPLATRWQILQFAVQGGRVRRRPSCALRQDFAADPRTLAARPRAVGSRRTASVRPLAGGVDRFAGRPPAPRRFDPRMRSICCGATRSSACCNAWPRRSSGHTRCCITSTAAWRRRAKRFATTTC